ncbi:MAG TPA: hypothetical protein PK095_03245, partial [Myxococcota bacterium]|nr:hypothetical protein [Myxococcota bacterium]
ATLRGEETTGKEQKAAKVNQDGLKRKIGGVIDIGKFIELDKKDEAEAAATAMPENEKPKTGKK